MSRKKAILLSLLLLNVVVWVGVYEARPSNVLKVVFLNIGQGDAIYIRAPSGNDMTIDAGPRDRSVLRELGAVMPWSDRDIDVALATHADSDHIGGLPDILERFHVGALIETGNPSLTNHVDELVDADAKAHDVPVVLAHRGTVVDLGDGVKFTILFPDKDVRGWDTNDSSIVGILSYGSRKFLFTGDSPAKIEHYLVGLAAVKGESLHADVLKPGHHGSKTATSQEYLDAVAPKYAVISAGKNNRYGHPAPIVMDRLAAANVQTFITFRDGRVEFDTDGTNLVPAKQFGK